MLKDTTYKQKFSILKSWMPLIIEDVKKDIKNEHLKKDWMFVKKYFGGKNVNKLSNEELVEVYIKAIDEEETGEDLGEFICSRWLMKNSEIYHFFEDQLKKIHPDFTEISEINKDKSKEILEKAVKNFGAPKSYLFSIMNSVVFPDEVYAELSMQAQQEIIKQEKTDQAEKEKSTLDDLQRHYDQQIARLTDKYEKKLLGMQNLVIRERETLKKQISLLQRKLNGQ